ncbi:MAG: hypothetical protein DMD35_19280 [Gemmatimonadetes bacterium]|nr:MAG: hypothetical protein DMD35_19280 [Gemmatimonadota bacterium]
MHAVLLVLSFQLGLVAQPAPRAQGRAAPSVADSTRDLRLARSAQASFERARRYDLPEGGGSIGRCDVRLGRYCWWYDEVPPDLPPESEQITRRRAELLATLDALGERHPGDDWIAGMRVHYRIDAKRPASADSVARSCGATSWWCLALLGYADHRLGRAAAAESAFVGAFATMPDTEACKWRDIAVLLPSNTRHYYEGLSCEARRAVEDRYWLLSRPQLAAPANDWRTEFYVRRVLTNLYRQATSTLQGAWGRDNEELLLRYGWPIGWRRYQTPYGSLMDISITEYQPVPSYNFAPVEPLYDTSATAQNDGWELEARVPEARYSPRLVGHVAPVAMQVARFRRGDSVLVVSAHAASHDSLGAAADAVLAVVLPDGTTRQVPANGRVGRARLMVESFPVLAGVEVADTVSRTLARARTLLRAPERAGGGLALSDLLLFRAAEGAPESIDAALEAAVPGDTLSRSRPIGIYWETYGIAESGESFDVGVTLERIDRSWIRGAKQLLRLAEPDNPLRLRWNDARPATPGQPISRAISLDVSNQSPGKYRITVGLIRADQSVVASTRVIELKD